MRWLAVAMLIAGLTPMSRAKAQDPGADRPLRASEPYDYSAAMREVAARFRGTPGVYLFLGDSLTYANQSTAWARGGRDHTPEEQAFLEWSHCGEGGDKDGWHLASVDVSMGRSHTAASGVRADEFLLGGKGGLPPLDAIVREYNPQLALYLLGSNDITAGRPVAAYIRDVEAAVDRLLRNGTVVILSTLPPYRGQAQQVGDYNEALRALARKRHLPLLDLHAELQARAGAAADTVYLAEDGIHLSPQPVDSDNPAPPGPASPSNLATYGYLLRCYLAVHKGMEVKAQVLDPGRLPHLDR